MIDQADGIWSSSVVFASQKSQIGVYFIPKLTTVMSLRKLNNSFTGDDFKEVIFISTRTAYWIMSSVDVKDTYIKFKKTFFLDDQNHDQNHNR